MLSSKNSQDQNSTSPGAEGNDPGTSDNPHGQMVMGENAETGASDCYGVLTRQEPLDLSPVYLQENKYVDWQVPGPLKWRVSYMRISVAASLGITSFALSLILSASASAETVVKEQYISTYDPGVLVTTITTRRSQLDKLYADAVAKNLFEQADRDLLRAELERIAAEEAVVRTLQGSLASSKVVLLARDLDTIGERMNIVLKQPVFVPIVEGSHFTIMEGKVVELDDVAKRRWELEGKISKFYLERRISADQANSLRKRMDVIASTEAGMRSDGDLSLIEGRKLYGEFDKVGSDLDHDAKK